MLIENGSVELDPQPTEGRSAVSAKWRIRQDVPEE